MIETAILIAAALLLFWLLYYALTSLFKRIVVWEYETGLKYRNGRFVGLAEPGAHWVFTYTTHIAKLDARPQYLTLPGQEVLSADGVSLRVSLVATYEIADAELAYHRISDYFIGFYTTAQVALREIVASRSIDDLLEKRAEFDAELLKHCAPEVQKLGIKLASLKVKDIMFPGDWKNVFAEVVRARQEGQAALERARGETAALRNLANAAKLMQDNPALLNLRTIQALGQSTGNTVILDLSGRAAQTSAKVQAADKPQPD